MALSIITKLPKKQNICFEASALISNPKCRQLHRRISLPGWWSRQEIERISENANLQNGANTLNPGQSRSEHLKVPFKMWDSDTNFAHSRDPNIARLDIEGNTLSDAWAQFRDKLPLDAQIQFAQRPQTFEDVISVVQEIEEKWQEKKHKGAWGRTKTCFRRVCTMLESHSNLLEILPSNSQYASIFCGTLQTLIKVRSYCATTLTFSWKEYLVDSCQGFSKLREDRRRVISGFA